VHNHASGFGGLVEGRELGPLEVTITPEANERFWTGVGVDHPAIAEGVLYPPIGVQFAIMLTRAAVAPDEVLHAGQTLQCHRVAHAGTPLVTSATVRNRYDKRGRTFVEVASETVTADGREPVWSGVSTFVAIT
jgi:hypothetical protein